MEQIKKIKLVGKAPELDYKGEEGEAFACLQGMDLRIFVNDSEKELRGITSIEISAVSASAPVKVKLGLTVEALEVELPGLTDKNRVINQKPVRYTFMQQVYNEKGDFLENYYISTGPYTFWGFKDEVTDELLAAHFKTNNEHLPFIEQCDYPDLNVIHTYELVVDELTSSSSASDSPS